jgi:hypothetical protein
VAALALELLVAAEDTRVSCEVCGRLADRAETLDGRRHGGSLPSSAVNVVDLERIETPPVSSETRGLKVRLPA